MYRVLVVEDEPAARQHLCRMLEMKCPDFEVAGIAENGKDALEQLEHISVDVLITDVRMPVMDGIKLVQMVREKYPEMFSVIVSGYQEFEYAQSAIRFGVCDYILKPIKPSVFQERMRIIQGRLDEYYYKLKNQIIKNMCTGNNNESPQFYRVFPEEEYYIALLRKNSLPRRFLESQGIEIFSTREEQMMVYGRDEMEALYICPKNLLFHNSFYQIMVHALQKEKRTAYFCTLVLRTDAVKRNELPEIIRRLYHILDHRLIIGETQIIEWQSGETEKEIYDNKDSLQRIRFLASEHNYEKISAEISKCFAEWEKKKCTQLWMEEKVREIFFILRNENLLEETAENSEYFIDDAFYYADSVGKLAENIQQILCGIKKEEDRKGKIDTPEFFQKIDEYIKEHLEENLSAQKICNVFGISQAYLSRLFKKYSSINFNKKVTLLRIEKAKKIMEERPELYIKDIASKVGFSDQFYFSRIFRSVTGISPTEYIEKR